MLDVTINENDLFDEATSTFIHVNRQSIRLEHSLVSLSKWESKWHKPFLTNNAKTQEELLDYIRCMTITQNVDPNAYKALSQSQLKEISDYINDPMTATTVPKTGGPPNREIVTSELIYYWMVALQIPFECQKWHLNRLLTLVQVCNFKNSPPKKMSKSALMARNKSLNAQRRAKLHSKG